MQVLGLHQNPQYFATGSLQKTASAAAPNQAQSQGAGFKSIYSQGVDSRALGALSFQGISSSMKKVSSNGEGTVRQDKDGAYKIDKAGTKLYAGKDAVKYLRNTTYHENNTKVIIPQSCKARLVANGEVTTVNPQSSIVLGESRQAKVEVLEGYPIVLVSPDEDNNSGEIYTVTAGGAALTVNENDAPRTIMLRAGESIVVQNGIEHSIEALKGSKYEHMSSQVAPPESEQGFEIQRHISRGYSYNPMRAA
jgi:mannose-6-phosphate isomerase-like protein (cupin superfamily)